MRVKYESEILKPEVRKQIITEIESSEERERKAESYRRFLCYKDQTVRYVVQNMLKQFDFDTVTEMRYALSNINITKKVVDKLSRVYSYGVQRSVSDDEAATKSVQELEKILNVNTSMKKTNRFLKLQRNIDYYVKPCPVYNEDGSDVRWTIKLEPLNPHLYSVVEDYYDRTKPLCHILTHYRPTADAFTTIDAGIRPSSPTLTTKGNSQDEKIADTAEDAGQGEKKKYIWWSNGYHFTTDDSGEIVPDENNPNNINPFGVSPIVSFAVDQDGAFWAEGGQDLIDGSILLNSMITHNNHVGVVQGYGQFYMTGENLPRSIKVGPTKAILAEYKKDEQAEPKMGFLSANPQLDSLRGNVEAYIALLLTTNNLSTTGISTQLSSGVSLPSGVALLIDKAESLEDVNDQRQVFLDNEPKIWSVIGKILDVYRDGLVDELKMISLPEDIDENLQIEFGHPQPIVSEKEKLENLKLRQEMGLDSMLSMLMKDDPSLDEKKAEEKLAKILEQRIMEQMKEQEVMSKLGAPEVESEDAMNDNSEDNKQPVDGQDQQQKPQPNGTPTVGDTAGSPDQNVQQLALNGAQVTAMVDLVEKVASGHIPRDAALNMIVTAFNVRPQDAEKILGEAGRSFKIEQQEQQPVGNQENDFKKV